MSPRNMNTQNMVFDRCNFIYVFSLFLLYFFSFAKIFQVSSVGSGKETEFHIEPELTLELMMAANYLHT